MKGFAMLKIGATGWIEKEIPKCGPMDAICKPLALAPRTSIRSGQARLVSDPI